MTRRPLAALCFLLAVVLVGCEPKDDAKVLTTNGPGKATPIEQKELVKIDVEPGAGPAAEKGDLVFVTYTGKLTNGTPFDSNDKPDANPLSFVLGNAAVIKGWDEGVVGMKVGGVRKLEIPPHLAYGNQSPPGSTIPPNSELHFEVKLLEMVKKGEEDVYDLKDLTVGSGRAAANGSTVTIHYKAKLSNGKEIDSTYERKKSESFTIGERSVIRGLEEGLIGMKAGGKRWLRIPPNIGYGAYGVNSVPGNQVVLFEVELLSVR